MMLEFSVKDSDMELLDRLKAVSKKYYVFFQSSDAVDIALGSKER